MNTEKQHYVYEWVRPDHDVVFYVGKGTRKRAWDFNRGNAQKHLMKIVRYLKANGMKPQVRILEQFATKDGAFDYEIERIAYWMPLGEIVNKTRGGEGGDTFSGKKHSAESIAKMSIAHKGKKKHYDVWNKGMPMPEDRKLQLVSINTGNKYFLGKTHSEETKAKLSLVMTGRPAPNKGKKASDETRLKMSKARAGITPRHLIRPVIELTENRQFESITAAAKNYGINVGQVRDVCVGRNKTVHGLVFKFAESLKV